MGKGNRVKGTKKKRRKLFSGPIIISKTSYLSSIILDKAIALTRESSSYESWIYTRRKFEKRPLSKYQGTVIASILMSASFMEVFLNEFVKDASSDGDNAVRLLPSVKENRSKFRKIDNRIPVTLRYQQVLDILECEQFTSSDDIFTNADLVRDLRNYFSHYKADEVELARFDLNKLRALPVKKHKFEEKLKGRFRENKYFVNTANPFFPDRCLGVGCAEWAQSSVVSLAYEFTKRVGLKDDYFSPNIPDNRQ